MSLFPSALSTDLEIPRVDDNITEVSGDVINALRDAVFAIEKALGLSIQGNTADLATRINSVIDENGRIKTAALESRGLISLPIVNKHIGDTAAIEESKLDLEYSTSYLFNRISSGNTNISALSATINSFVSDLSKHFTGLQNRHDGYDIDMVSYTRNGGGTNIEKAIHLLDNEFVQHTDISSAHDAINITVDNNFRNISATNVQEALQELSYVDPGIIEHQDEAHDNAIFTNLRSEQGPQVNLNSTTMASTIYQTNTGAPFLTNNILQVMRPNVARITGTEIDFGALSSGSADTLRIQAGGLGRSYVDVSLSAIIPTDNLDEIVETINASLHSNANHYPVSAYNTGGRLTIAHHIPGWDKTMGVDGTVGNSAHTALGFANISGNTYSWADGYCGAYIGGYKATDFKSILKIRYDHTAAADLNRIDPGLGDLSLVGFDVGDEGRVLCNITNHSTASYNGTYYIVGYAGSTGFYLNQDIAQSEFDIEVVADSVNFSDSARGQIFDIFAEYDEDGYAIITKSLHADYITHSGVDIKAISKDFPVTSIQWKVTDAEYVELLSAGESGSPVHIPDGFVGEIKVYASDNINSALMQVTGSISPADGTHNITVSAFDGDDDKLHLSSVHYSGNYGSRLLKFVSDKRKIGGAVENDYKDRLSLVPLSEALKELRNNGVIRGFDIISNTSNTIRVRGGRALINGKIIEVATKNITIDSFTFDKRLLLLDEFGNYKAVDINTAGYNESEFITDDSYGDIRNVAVIADFGTTATALNGTFTDRRFFVGKIDKRLADTENRLNRRIDNLFSSTTGAVWAFRLAHSSDAYGDGVGNITTSDNVGLAEVDQRGFAGGDSSITTRRFEVIDGYGLNLFQSQGQTHLNLMIQLNYGAQDGGVFGTSGEVNILCGFDVVTGMTIRSHEGSSRLIHSEQYVRIKTINTTVFPVPNVTENYILSIPTYFFSNLVNNICFDAMPRIKITGCNFVDGGTSGSPSPDIRPGLIRVVGSSYSIAGSLLGQDGNDDALAVTVGEIL